MALYGRVTIPGRPDLDNIRLIDHNAIPMVRNFHRRGIAVDREYLWDLGSKLGREMVDLQKQIASYIPPDRLQEFSTRSADIEETYGDSSFNANSAEQIRKLLFDCLSVGQGKDLKVTSSGAVSTDKKTLSKLEHDHPVVRLIQDYRQRSKLKNTYTDKLPLKAKLHPASKCCPICEWEHEDATWRIHTEFLMTRTETRRLASKNPNLQNIPIRSSLGTQIRKGFVATPGYSLVSADFAQIELRDLAHLATCLAMIKIYQERGDLHAFTAMNCFGIDNPDDIDKTLHRIPAKTVNFAVVYGISGKALSAQLIYYFGELVSEGKMKLAQYHELSSKWTPDYCQDFIDRWFDLYPEVRAYMDLQELRARKYGLVWNPFGGIRLVPEVRSTHYYIVKAGIRQAGNVPIQGTNGEQTKIVMAELQDYFDMIHDTVPVYPLLAIHDQLIVETPTEFSSEIGNVMVDCFCNVMVDKETGQDYWRVPIRSDVEITERWEKAA